MNSMKETRGVALPNLMGAKVHSNLIAVEVNTLYKPALDLLSKSRACYDRVIGKNYSLNSMNISNINRFTVQKAFRCYTFSV